MATIFLHLGLLLLGLVLALWALSLFLRNSSIIDIFWGIGFVIAGWFYFIQTVDGYGPRKWITVILVTVWGVRLALHIYLRNRGKGEDFRYRAWREQAGSGWWWQSLFRVFLLQGALLWIISTPLLAAQVGPVKGLGVLDFLGMAAWAVGFFFEAVGDWQLARFKSNPANQGKVYRHGVWRYTRHPNYYGDAVQWWGWFLIAASAGGWWTIYSPILMTFLLVRVSGVAMLERTLKETRPGYREYIETTSAFFPWFPKSR